MQIDKMNKTKYFKGFISRKCQNLYITAIVKLSILSLMVIFAIYGYFEVQHEVPLIIGGITLLYMISVFYDSRGDLKGGEYWLQLIEEQPEQIVWIKPIQVSYKTGWITTDQELQFQILTRDKLKIRFTCDEGEQKTLFDGAQTYLPKVHFGYSDEVSHLFDKSPKAFISQLEEEGLYQPIASFARAQS